MHQSSPVAGAWKVAACRALSLRPREPGVLTVLRGRLWVTSGGLHGLSPQDSGDHVLAAGQQLTVPPGAHVVLEGWPGEDAFFDWQPRAALAAVAVSPREAVLQPLADLRQAAALAGGALGRLGAGVVRLAWSRWAGRHNASALTPVPWLAPSPSSTTSSATRSWT